MIEMHLYALAITINKITSSETDYQIEVFVLIQILKTKDHRKIHHKRQKI